MTEPLRAAPSRSSWPQGCPLEDSEEHGTTESCFFCGTAIQHLSFIRSPLRTAGAWMDLQWYLNQIPRQTKASVAQPDLSEPLRGALQHAGCSSPRAVFRRLEEVITSPTGERKSLDLWRLLKRWKLLLLRICGVRSVCWLTGERNSERAFLHETGIWGNV